MKFTLLTITSVLLTVFSCNTNQSVSEQSDSNIIFKDSLGNTISKNDLENVTGNVNYEIMGSKRVDPKAESLHQEARKLGQSGEYDLSISKLKEAIEIQPEWAYPTYDLAFTYLLKGDYENALIFYKKTNELEPKGFFTAKTAVYALEGEKSGKFPTGLYGIYLQIEWTDNESKKFEIAKTITEKVPDFAPAWKDLANLLDDRAEKLKAIEQGLSKKPDAETMGVLIINKALVLDMDGKKEEAQKILGNLIFSSEVTTGNKELAKFALKSISEK
jgi:tetratricopeptide (TPR) repeat protein